MTAWMRYFYRDLGREEQEKKFTQSISDSYSNTKLLTLHFNSTLKDCSDTLTYDYSAIAPKVFTTINGLYIVNLPLIDKLKPMDFLSIEERKFPVEVWKYALGDTSTEKLTIAFPENQKLAEVPKTVHFSCKQADYTLTFMVQGKELKVERRMINLKDEVPVSDYTAYRTFIESVVNADSQKIGFLTANNK